jgi:hypothetical protein
MSVIGVPVWWQEQLALITEELFSERQAGFTGAAAAFHDLLPFIQRQFPGFVDQQSGNVIDDGVAESGSGAGADQSASVLHEF